LKAVCYQVESESFVIARRLLGDKSRLVKFFRFLAAFLEMKLVFFDFWFVVPYGSDFISKISPHIREKVP